MWAKLLTNLRAAYRLTRASGCVVIGLCAAGITAAPGLREKRPQIATWWFQSLLRSLNVQLEVEGEPAHAGCLQVANHISWLDIVVLGAAGSSRFVSKAEVGDWPGDGPGMAEINAAVSWRFTQLKMPGEVAAADWPALAAFSAAAERHPAFREFDPGG